MSSESEEFSHKSDTPQFRPWQSVVPSQSGNQFKTTMAERREIQRRQRTLLDGIGEMDPDFEVFKPSQKGKFKRKSEGDFRGSVYRGVSKNGNRW